jgi:hypothetical protein
MLAIQTRIALDDGPKDWGLYLDMPESYDVAAELDATVQEAVNGGAQRHEVERMAAAVMERRADSGAADFEAREHLRRLLDRIFGG